jgi:hypothetical protein
MGYYIRILGTKDPDIHLDELLNGLQADGLKAKLALAEDDAPDRWSLIEIANNNDEILAQVERNPVIDGELGKEELDEFREIVADFKPSSAADWLISYFNRVKVIYAIQMLHATLDEHNFKIVDCIRTKIWNITGGILQADNEGFTNEDGYHILWQFANDASGEWNCAVLNASGSWDNFTMDLADSTQRKEFQAGRLPKQKRKPWWKL